MSDESIKYSSVLTFPEVFAMDTEIFSLFFDHENRDLQTFRVEVIEFLSSLVP
jgi:hypothetical protein